MESTELTITSGNKATTVDLTDEIAGFCADKGDGLLSVFVPHATVSHYWRRAQAATPMSYRQ